MSVQLRKYQGSSHWEIDIRVQLPNGTTIRERKKAPGTGKAAAHDWGRRRERELIVHGKPRPIGKEAPRLTTLKEFAPRFIDGHARAERQKPSGIAAKEAILRLHLLPRFGARRLAEIWRSAANACGREDRRPRG